MDELIDQLSSRENIRMRPLDLEVFAAMRELHPGMEMHDRIIAATARLYEATVITKDPAFEGVVETLW